MLPLLKSNRRWQDFRAVSKVRIADNTTYVQYTQTHTNRQETLTNGIIGKKSPFVKEALQFAPLVRLESSSVHWYTICKLHLITT